MLGLGGGEMALAYWLCILSALGCVVYGLVNWNRGSPDVTDLKEDLEYRKKDRALEETLP